MSRDNIDKLLEVANVLADARDRLPDKNSAHYDVMTECASCVCGVAREEIATETRRAIGDIVAGILMPQGMCDGEAL